jgi:geranyl-CoA carboxylase alpha subunit
VQTLAIATVLLHENQLPPASRRGGRANWRSGDNSLPIRYHLQSDDDIHHCELFCLGEHSYRVQACGQSICLDFLNWKNATAELQLEGSRLSRLCICGEDTLHLVNNHRQWQFRTITYAPAAAADKTGNGRILAPMDGCIVDVCVQTGAPVSRGDTLAVMEAMKMEHPLKADRDGILASALIAAGDQVRGGQLLLRIDAAEASSPTVVR